MFQVWVITTSEVWNLKAGYVAAPPTCALCGKSHSCLALGFSDTGRVLFSSC